MRLRPPAGRAAIGGSAGPAGAGQRQAGGVALHNDGGCAAHRALELADAAVDAEAGDDRGALHPVTAALGVRHVPPVVELDGLPRRGAHLLADDARRALCPRQAAVPVDDGDADDLRAFLLQPELGDRAGGAGVAAGGAGVVAVAEAWPEDGAPQALEARLVQRRLQPGRGADLHALAAAQAEGEERALGCLLYTSPSPRD